jgi:hypothetical protein
MSGGGVLPSQEESEDKNNAYRKALENNDYLAQLLEEVRQIKEMLERIVGEE